MAATGLRFCAILAGVWVASAPLADARFLQTDPVGYEAGHNLYMYAGNDPINGIDPTGLLSCSGDVQKCSVLEEDAAAASAAMRQVAGDLRGLRQAIRSDAVLTPEQEALQGAFEGVFGEGSATSARLGNVAGNLESGADWLDADSTTVRFASTGVPLNVRPEARNTLQVDWSHYRVGSAANRVGWMAHDSGHGIGLMDDTYPVPLYAGRPNGEALYLYGNNLAWFARTRGPDFVTQVPDAMRCIAAPWSAGAPAGFSCP
jgi:uncharacterized protein RhaS with RHS repeats